jgi:hypothetical protein
MCPAHL